jgi:tRNA-uridine 2-sulfurtransferase
MAEQKRAVALISGGLDSMLAAKVVMEQGVHVEGVNFYTGFCVEGHTHAIRRTDAARQKRNNALWVAEQLGIKLHIVDVIEEYKDVLLNPKHGYGSNINPCLDCKVFMVKKAQAWSFMAEHQFDFIITGEVMGQRPMSQRKATLPIVARESGVEDRLLRPLSAQHLPETLPEREGWVDRKQLFGFHGRNRKPQIELAKSYGFSDWAQPAGGCCFLTNPQYAEKLQDLWDARGVRDYELDDIMLLKVGRHVRPAPHFKIIVGREEGENRYLRGYKKRYISLEAADIGGPVALIDGNPTQADIKLAASVVARYGQGRDLEEVTVNIQHPNGDRQNIPVTPMHPDHLPKTWHV